MVIPLLPLFKFHIRCPIVCSIVRLSHGTYLRLTKSSKLQFKALANLIAVDSFISFTRLYRIALIVSSDKSEA